MGKAQGGAWASQAGAAFSNPFTIELARDCENTSLTRFASAPALAAEQSLRNSEGLKVDGEPRWQRANFNTYYCGT